MTLQEQIKSRSITYAQIARHLGVSRQYMSAMMTNITEKSKYYEAIVDYVLSHDFNKLHVGDIVTSNSGCSATVISTDPQHKTAIIEFNDEFKHTTEYTINILLSGKFKNPYCRNIYGVGYSGIGDYTSASHPKLYNRWQTMLQRCYSQKLSHKYASVGKVTVDPRWHNLQTFCDDITQLEHHGSPNYRFTRYGDIYSPDTCKFTPCITKK